VNLLTTLAQSTTATEATCTVNGQQVDCAQAASTAGGIMIVLGIVGLVLGIFTLWMFIHALTHNSKNKVMWALIIFFTGFLGAAVYFFTERKKVNNPSATDVAGMPNVMPAGQSPAVEQNNATVAPNMEQPVAPEQPQPVTQTPTDQPQPVVTPEQPANDQNQQPPQVQ
jgi:hypothetical protein